MSSSKINKNNKNNEIELYESFIDNSTSDKMYYGIRKIKISSDSSYCIYDGVKRPLEFISYVKFGIPGEKVSLAGRNMTRYFIYRTEMNDLLVIYKLKNDNFIFDHVEFMNIEFRQK
jgi:hypothetical protein